MTSSWPSSGPTPPLALLLHLLLHPQPCRGRVLGQREGQPLAPTHLAGLALHGPPPLERQHQHQLGRLAAREVQLCCWMRAWSGG